jgi:hypothetical protein
MHCKLPPTVARYECCSVNCGCNVTKESSYQQHFGRFCYHGASAALSTSINRIISQHVYKYLANKRDVRVTHVLTVIRFFDNAAWPANGSICIYFRMTNANDMLTLTLDQSYATVSRPSSQKRVLLAN